MLLQTLKQEGYLFNVNLSGELDGTEVYRGDLVLEFGEVTERGDRKPPLLVAKQAVLSMAAGKIQLFVAGLDRLADLSRVLEHYGAWLDRDNCQTLFFVHDIKDAMQVEAEGLSFLLEPLDDGMIWNEALELLCIEKSDLKGQSAEQKVATLLAELGAHRRRCPSYSLEEALGMTVEVKVAARGPV